MLKLEDVTKKYGGLAAVSGVTLSFPESEICAVIGPNGAGKTTLFSLIAGSLAPMSSTPNLASTPVSARATAVFSAVWPPMVGSSASGRSRSMILAATFGVIGSM